MPFTDTKFRDGPQTPEGKARSLEALARNRDPLAACTHQGRRWETKALAPSCDHCADREHCEHYRKGDTCILAEQQVAETVESIMALPHVQATDRPLAVAYARTATLLEILARYVANVSPLLPGSDAGYLEAQPVMHNIASAETRLVKLASELGLSPAARARLGLNEDGKPRSFARLLAIVEGGTDDSG